MLSSSSAFSILYKMTGVLAVCAVLCILATTGHSFPSKYYEGFQRPVSPVERVPETYAYRQRIRFQTNEVPGDSYYPDEHHGQRIDVDTEVLPTQPAKVQSGFDPSMIKITEEGDKICVSYSVFRVCFKKSDVSEQICGLRLGGALTLGCRLRDEENYLGLCYKKCSILTHNSYPLRTATNTCAKNGCGPNEEENAGLCYPKCEQYYTGVGAVCWGYCNHFCGSDYNDLGLYCYRWWPPHSCSKPSYGRGVGILPYAPWTNGLGCNDFGINGDGGCALIDVLNYIDLPYGITCP